MTDPQIQAASAPAAPVPVRRTRPAWQRWARDAVRALALPILSLVLFCGLWHALASQLKFGSQSLPTPVEVGAQVVKLVQDHIAARARHAAATAEWRVQFAKAEQEYAGQLSLAELEQALPRPVAEQTIADWILTSLYTVFTGFIIATAIGVPLGIICGLSNPVWQLCNPLVQLFKPVSPLAWLPMVAILVGAAVSSDSGISKSWLTAGIVVAVCSVWPTLINTANGVANVERDYLNVAKVLNLGFFTKVVRIILPASLPAIFTGMRLSLGIGWMVLIAAEMLSQNPGLGKFIWDMYQSSNDATLAMIAATILIIGVIGFALDRTMIGVQRLVARGAPATVR
ncbi:MAG: ABC transporter permease [Planctomycetes bacterium]|nr:ABC transporter permease [Planctomycetota bacterium]